MPRLVEVGTSQPVHITGSDVALGSGSSDASLAEQQTQTTALGAINETAPVNDTAASGLNGRLQRIAQRLTSLIALFPASIGQKNKAGSLSVTWASDADALPSGENVIGAVAGKSTIVTPSITVSTSPAYSSGDSIGGKITLTSAIRVSAGTGYLQSLMILDRANQKPTGTVVIFNADPTTATLTDNALVVMSTDDVKIVATITISATDYTTINNKAYANIKNIGSAVKTASGTTLYAVFVTTSTPTFAATTDLQIQFGFLQD